MTRLRSDIAFNLLSTHGNNMELGYYDTKTNKFVTVDTAYNTHHLQFDWQDRIWTDGGGSAMGEMDTKKLDLNNIQGTEEAAQKTWMRIDMDTKKMIPGTGYGVASALSTAPFGKRLRKLGPQRTSCTCLIQRRGNSKITRCLLRDVSRMALTSARTGMFGFRLGSGHLGRLDVKTGQWKFWDDPGVKFKGTGSETGTTDFPYFLWVDQFNASGLGKDTVIVTGTASDAMFIFDPKKETFSVFHLPYPLPYYTRGLDGRIDDAKAGWKGRGLWMTYSSYMPKFTETRKGSVTHMQIRPNPLAN